MIRILRFGKYISVALLSAAGDWLVFSRCGLAPGLGFSGRPSNRGGLEN